MEITLLGVLLALLITAAILFAYQLGKTVGKDAGFKEGADHANYIHKVRSRGRTNEEPEVTFFFGPNPDEELWD